MQWGYTQLVVLTATEQPAHAHEAGRTLGRERVIVKLFCNNIISVDIHWSISSVFSYFTIRSQDLVLLGYNDYFILMILSHTSVSLIAIIEVLLIQWYCSFYRHLLPHFIFMGFYILHIGNLMSLMIACQRQIPIWSSSCFMAKAFIVTPWD